VKSSCEAATPFACFNREGLSTILPHRGQALRKIDGIFYDLRNSAHITGFKMVGVDEPEFDGHFPDAPTYPGYAQDEFACLTAAALILYSPEGRTGNNPHVVQKIAKYKKSVSPGDTLKAEITLVGKKSRFFLFSGKIINQHGELVAEYEKIVGAL
jgi:3-hydroxyacyl-[acyl-carrier-protein] dehydratase